MPDLLGAQSDLISSEPGCRETEAASDRDGHTNPNKQGRPRSNETGMFTVLLH